MEEHHVLGVDGGGSMTRCVIASLSGHILARGSGGPSNPLTAGLDGAAEAIRAAVEEASRRYGINSFIASVMGLAGSERASTIEPLVARLTLLDLGDLTIIGDAQVALAGATECRPGVVVISGTGSIAYGENDAGRPHGPGAGGRGEWLRHREQGPHRARGGSIDEVYLSGGGAKNFFLVESLRERLDPIPVGLSDDLGLPGDAKEAVLMTVLANEHLAGNPGNVPGATGARRPVVLGAFYPAP